MRVDRHALERLSAARSCASSSACSRANHAAVLALLCEHACAVSQRATEKEGRTDDGVSTLAPIVVSAFTGKHC